MPAFLSLTCSRADLHKLDQLIATLSPVFGKHGGILLDRQGPAAGFFDPVFQGMAEIRLYRFADRAHVEQALADPGYAATAILRGSFIQLDIRIDDA